MQNKNVFTIFDWYNVCVKIGRYMPFCCLRLETCTFSNRKIDTHDKIWPTKLKFTSLFSRILWILSNTHILIFKSITFCQKVPCMYFHIIGPKVKLINLARKGRGLQTYCQWNLNIFVILIILALSMWVCISAKYVSVTQWL